MENLGPFQGAVISKRYYTLLARVRGSRGRGMEILSDIKKSYCDINDVILCSICWFRSHMTSLMFIVTSHVFVVDTLLTPQHLHVTCPSCFGDSAREKIGRPANHGVFHGGPRSLWGQTSFFVRGYEGLTTGWQFSKRVCKFFLMMAPWPF
jgi:hypothetical protein